jgi:hypothetical protein
MIPCPKCDEPCNAYSKRRIGEGKEFYHRCKSCDHRFKTHQPDLSNPERFYQEMHQFKLSKADRMEIIERYSRGGISYVNLGLMYDVNGSTIRHVIENPHLTAKLND